MKIGWATDVHFNSMSQAGVERFCDKVNASGVTTLLLGGDIAEATDLAGWLTFLDKRIEPPTYFVLGNHDYYQGNMGDVHQAVRHLPLERLTWLRDTPAVSLDTRTGLIGHSGWGDARFGDFDNSPVILSDYLLIEDLRDTVDPKDVLAGFRRRAALKDKLQELGDDAAATLRRHLVPAAGVFKKLIVLTHVPPFRESCWYDNTISDDNYLPGFTCKAIGDLLLEAAEASPDCDMTVLCGHTHGGGYTRMRPNLEVFTGAAKYGKAYFRIVELSGGKVNVSSA